MMTTFNSSIIPSSPNLNPLFASKLKPTIFPTTSRLIFPPSRAALTIKCTSSEKNEPANLKDVLSGLVDQSVEELLNKEENKDLLDGLQQASQRVEMAKIELAEIKRQEAEAKLLRDYINRLESQTSEIAECQKDISEAKAMIKEAERSLEISNGGGKGIITKNEERVESIKAALISAIIGTFASLPISLTRITNYSELILPLTITFISCALFGVTFRYAIRRDLENFQLKSGTSAAFGFVKGLAILGAGPPLEMDVGSFLSHASDGAVYVSENLLIFLFASVGLDLCIKLRILSPFPIDEST